MSKGSSVGSVITYEVTTSANIPAKLTTLIADLEKGPSILQLLGGKAEFPIPNVKASSASDLTAKMVDVITALPRADGVQGIADLGVFMDSIFKKYTDGALKLEEAAFLTALVAALAEQIAPELAKDLGSEHYSGMCPGCGAGIMMQGGRRPNFCPRCACPLASMAGFVPESENKICPACFTIFEKAKDMKECKNCTSSLVYMADPKGEFPSAMMEVFFVCSSVPMEGGEAKIDVPAFTEFLREMELPLRKNNILRSYLSETSNVKGLLLSILRRQFLGDEGDKGVLEAVEKVGKDGVQKMLIEMDSTTLTVLHPVLKFLDSKESPLPKQTLDRIREEEEAFYGNLNSLKVWLLALPEETQSTVFGFLEGMYELSSSVLERSREYTPKEANDIAVKIIGENTLKRLREEVKQRNHLHEGVKTLKEDGFDINQATKAFSSCLTRVVIEQEREKSLPLEIFKGLVFEKMGLLFLGKKAEPVNFIRGVFLSEEDW